MKDRVTNVWITGVGGQGTLLASELLAMAALESGLDVKKSEVHGMAQRGGSVVSQVRLGKKVYSPLIASGDADVLLAFEKAEALRYASVLQPDGVVLVNDLEIPSSTVLSGEDTYPEGAEDVLRKIAAKVLVVPGAKLAKEIGNPRVLNVVLLGVLSKLLPLAPEAWPEVIRKRVPAKFVDLNLAAFAKGRQWAEENGL